MVKSQGFLWVILHQFEFEKKRRPAFGVNEATQVFFLVFTTKTFTDPSS